ncbi:MAG: Uncharacterised protein [Gammaproteobacteria bacterium]|nr:MAG: Uncharacterised protein [Gammaproteobacteria bacterium]
MIGVVGHDAGGMEIISSHIRRQGLNCGFCLEGAAVNVVARKLGTVPMLPLEALVERCEWLLCGTSFVSDLEWRAIGLARQAGKHCIVVLDHWINYRQRFSRHGQCHWPDEVWVGDETAARIAREDLPELRQTLVPNAYFLDIQDEIKARSVPARAPGDGLNILYACEPLRDDGIALYGDERYWGYTEEEALTYFLSHVHLLAKEINSIVVRPHPQEPSGKYDWAVTQFDLPLICVKNKTLIEQITACDIVSGCATMAMVVGLLAGKRVVSCIPPGGKTVSLPQREIEDMSLLITASQTQH